MKANESDIERFWSKVDKTTGCWLWTGTMVNGYGQFWSNADWRLVGAHRVSYFLARGDIDDSLVIDHICRVTACVNPDHLRQVNHAENILAGIGPTAINARKTHCSRGHAFTPENTYVRRGGTWRECRTCRAIYHQRRIERKSA